MKIKLNAKEWINQIIAYISLFFIAIFVGFIAVLIGVISIIWSISDQILLLLEKKNSDFSSQAKVSV